MKNEEENNKHVAGDIVCAKVNPEQKLIVRRYTNRIYYCRIVDHPKMKELVYFDREIVKKLKSEKRK